MNHTLGTGLVNFYTTLVQIGTWNCLNRLEFVVKIGMSAHLLGGFDFGIKFHTDSCSPQDNLQYLG